MEEVVGIRGLKIRIKEYRNGTFMKLISESEEILIAKYVYVFFCVCFYNRMQVFLKKIFI